MGSAMQKNTPFQLHKLTNGGPDCATNVFAFLVSLHSKGSGGSLLDEFPCVWVAKEIEGFSVTTDIFKQL